MQFTNNIELVAQWKIDCSILSRLQESSNSLQEVGFDAFWDRGCDWEWWK
jgi:hypothetical protein